MHSFLPSQDAPGIGGDGLQQAAGGLHWRQVSGTDPLMPDSGCRLPSSRFRRRIFHAADVDTVVVAAPAVLAAIKSVSAFSPRCSKAPRLPVPLFTFRRAAKRQHGEGEFCALPEIHTIMSRQKIVCHSLHSSVETLRAEDQSYIGTAVAGDARWSVCPERASTSVRSADSCRHCLQLAQLKQPADTACFSRTSLA